MKFAIIVLFFMFSNIAQGMVEISGNFGYNKTVFGAQRENYITNRTWSGTLALYLWNMTAIELNYSDSEEISTENTDRDIDEIGAIRLGYQQRVRTKVYGIGLRQAFANRKSRIIPLISMGYAKQFSEDDGEATYKLDSDNSTQTVFFDKMKKRQESVFAAFLLKIRITGGLSIQGSIKTIFPAFEYNEAKNNLKYLVGISWMF